jgi:hypothetical protein
MYRKAVPSSHFDVLIEAIVVLVQKVEKNPNRRYPQDFLLKMYSKIMLTAQRKLKTVKIDLFDSPKRLTNVN